MVKTSSERKENNENGNFLQKLKRLTQQDALVLNECIFKEWQWEEIVVYLNEHPEITKLVARSCEINEQTAECIADAKSLSFIDLQDNKIVGNGVAKLAALDLDELILSSNPLKDEDLRHFASSDIKKISLNACGNIEGWGIATLFKNPNIVTLELEQLNIENKDLSTLRDTFTLKELDIQNCQYLTYEMMDYIAANKSLETLNVSFNTNIGDMGIKKLSSKSSLTSLNITQTGVTDEAISDLIKIPRLSCLNAKLNNFTGAGIKILKENVKDLFVSSPLVRYAQFTLFSPQENAIIKPTLNTNQDEKNGPDVNSQNSNQSSSWGSEFFEAPSKEDPYNWTAPNSSVKKTPKF